jgi:hypothetical protein
VEGESGVEGEGGWGEIIQQSLDSGAPALIARFLSSSILTDLKAVVLPGQHNCHTCVGSVNTSIIRNGLVLLISKPIGCMQFISTA